MAGSWKRVPLAEIAEFTSKPRELRLADYKAIPFVPMELIPSDKIAIDGFLMKDPSVISSGTFFKEGDILLPKITPSFENGKQAIAKDLPLPFGLATTEVIPLREKANISDKLFLFYFLLKGDVRQSLASKMEGTTGRQRLNTEALKTLPVPLPPLPEQRAIARVLRAVQEVMQALRRELELERERKAALMHHLFRYGTRGEPTKQTEIGEIPQSWKVVRLRDIVTLQRGVDLPIQRRSPGTIPVVGSNGIVGWHNQALSDEPVPGITIGRSGSVGSLCYLEQPYWPLNTVLYVSDFHGNDPQFIYYWLHLFGFEKYSQGVSVPTLNRNSVYPILFPLPPLEEQLQIAQIMAVSDLKITALEQELALYQELFRALLEELMSGRLSVQPLLEQEPA
ncbi:restriction endonuclease subunit S [Thermogemmatispora onikobensis]|uniref:restriction endonuclease subunit S n=1 Tax=Thermogemmatispora onikobensis TaxID=732234 RepID=UPI000A07B3D2|nr:restriction endonuclease subunit S [Thermogemmatispora onikobensis]